MSDVHLRRARSTDAGTVGAILSAFIDDTAWMPRIHSRAEEIGFVGTLIERDWVTVAEQADDVTGFMACDGQTIQSLYVAAKARRQGVGSALLQVAQERQDALTLWTFQANAEAQAFYVAHGFVAAARTDGSGNDEGLPDIRYDWKRETA